MKSRRTGYPGCSLALIILFVILTTIGSSATSAYGDYVWGEASAAEANDPEHDGYWQYCISVGWDVSEYPEGAHGTSHLSLVLELEDCLADCGEACFHFPDTIGMGDGVGGCIVYFYAELDVKGDPTIPAEIPAVKFEPYPSTCEPDIAGTADVCFYSLMAPEEGGGPPASVWIKFGPYIEKGLITGDLPSCSGTVPTGRSTWSSIKRLFY